MAGVFEMSHVETYCDATKDVSLEALTRSVEQFKSGRVERNNSFPPAAAEVAENARQWQRALDSRASNSGPPLHNGLLEMDWGQGMVNLRGLTNAEQDQVIAAKGVGPDGRSLAYMPVEQIRVAISQGDIAQLDGGNSFKAPRLGRIS